MASRDNFSFIEAILDILSRQGPGISFEQVNHVSTQRLRGSKPLKPFKERIYPLQVTDPEMTHDQYRNIYRNRWLYTDNETLTKCTYKTAGRVIVSLLE